MLRKNCRLLMLRRKAQPFYFVDDPDNTKGAVKVRRPKGGTSSCMRPVRSLLQAVTVAFALLSAPMMGSESELARDLKQRRVRVMKALGADTVVVLLSAPRRVYSRDVDYRYRQDHNLYYLTGIDQPGTTLVLMPGNDDNRGVLFVAPGTHAREHWDGKVLTRDEAKLRSGITSVYYQARFEDFLDSLLDRESKGSARPLTEKPKEFAIARLLLDLDKGKAPGNPAHPTRDFAQRMQDRYPGIVVEDVSSVFRDARQIKTEYERRILRRSVGIASRAHLAAMNKARAGVNEYEVEAELSYVYRSMGASGWSYPPIVGSGPNAMILHYTAANRRMRDGDLLLIDSACHYQYLTGDITRTFPVNGTFTKEQSDIYRVVLSAQDAAMQMVVPGVSPREIHQKTVEVIKAGLLELGLITDALGDQYRLWYTHGSFHFIGMDVHDVGDQAKVLMPGMAFVIEPGIYIRPEALTSLPKTLENRWTQRIQTAFRAYKGIGVRIEDSFLMTDSGAERLSADVPRTVEEIEAFLKSRPAGTR